MQSLLQDHLLERTCLSLFNMWAKSESPKQNLSAGSIDTSLQQPDMDFCIYPLLDLKMFQVPLGRNYLFIYLLTI